MGQKDQRKRILHVSKYYYPFRGGTEQIAQDCVNALKNDYEQKVICFNHEKGDRQDYVDDIEIIRCGTFAKISSQSLSLTYERNFRKVIKSFNPDIIVFHYPNPFVAAILLRNIPKSTKLVTYWHLDIVKQKILGKLFTNQNKQLIKRSNVIIATSPNYVEGSPYLSKTKDKCVVVPNCINVERLELTDEINRLSDFIREKNKDKIICLAVGRHTKYKGFEYLIKASKKLDDRFVIYITGKGEETKKLKKLAADDPKVNFLGVVNDKELKAYLKSMDIFCFPSITKNEAFGVALAEGMYFGKPAVTFNIPGSGVNYVCINNEDGLEVPNKDINGYANALKMLGNNPTLRKEYGKNGKERVIKKFLNHTYNKNIKNVISAVKNI